MTHLCYSVDIDPEKDEVCNAAAQWILIINNFKSLASDKINWMCGLIGLCRVNSSFGTKCTQNNYFQGWITVLILMPVSLFRSLCLPVCLSHYFCYFTHCKPKCTPLAVLMDKQRYLFFMDANKCKLSYRKWLNVARGKLAWRGNQYEMRIT